MYLDFFGLHKPPFRITPDTSAFFEGSDRGPILSALCYAIERGEGIVRVVGEVGTGKTMLCRMLPHMIADGVEWVYLAHPSLSPEQMLAEIAREMRLRAPTYADKLQLMRRLQRALLRRYASDQRVVVLVEEAQEMPLETLEELRLLSNLETDDHKLLQIVLFGQPELDVKLAHREIRQLRERITHSLYLRPFALDDIHAYLNFRMRVAGYRGPDIFTKPAAREIGKFSRGLTRRINILADKTLLSAYSNGRHLPAIKDIRKAADDSQYRAGARFRLWPQALTILLMGSIVPVLQGTEAPALRALAQSMEITADEDSLHRTPGGRAFVHPSRVRRN